MAIRNLIIRITAMAFVSSVVFFGFSCDRGGSGKVNFFIDYEWEAAIPPGSTIGVPFEVLTPEQGTDADAKFGNNGTQTDFVIDVFVKSCQMDISYPSGQTFDFLNSVEVLISANGLQDTLLAKANSIPENELKSLSFTLAHHDYVEYLKKDNFKLLLRTKTDQTIEEEIGIKIYTEFEVIADGVD